MRRSAPTIIALWGIVSGSVATADQSLLELFGDTIHAVRDAHHLHKDEDERRYDIEDKLIENVEEFAVYAARREVSAQFEARRIDKQFGASGGNSGSTLVSKASVPSLLSMAIESGALYQSVSENVATVRLNPAGIARALRSRNYWESGVSDNEFEQLISALSLSASIEIPDGFPSTFAEATTLLREATVRIDLINQRDPRDPSNLAALTNFADAVENFFKAIEDLPAYQQWVGDAAAILNATNVAEDDAITRSLRIVGDDFATIVQENSALHGLALTVSDEVLSYQDAKEDALSEVAESIAWSVEYAYSKLAVPVASLDAMPNDLVAPDLSTVRTIVGFPLGAGNELTATLSGSIFHSTFPEMDGPIRDVRGAASLDVYLPDILSIGSPVFTLAVLASYLFQQPFGVKVPLRDIETDDGLVMVAQAKITLPIGDSGVKVPISVTAANRSEFVTEEWQLNASIGATFDADVLFSRF